MWRNMYYPFPHISSETEQMYNNIALHYPILKRVLLLKGTDSHLQELRYVKSDIRHWATFLYFLLKNIVLPVHNTKSQIVV